MSASRICGALPSVLAQVGVASFWYVGDYQQVDGVGADVGTHYWVQWSSF